MKETNRFDEEERIKAGGNAWSLKEANIRHHNAEAEIFEQVHPEGSSIYERTKVGKSIGFIVKNSNETALCVDVGCGTGFVTSFELPVYNNVVAMDISRRMVEVARKKLGHFANLNLVLCDAEFLPLRNEIADLISVSSVLHHLPEPSNLLNEISRVLKYGGFLYVTREPNLQHFRRFSELFDKSINKPSNLLGHLSFFKTGDDNYKIAFPDGLDYAKADIHYHNGFHVAWLCEFLRSKSFEVFSAQSYHWVYPRSSQGILNQLLSKSNFVIEKIPFAKKLGRYLVIIGRKNLRNMHKATLS